MHEEEVNELRERLADFARDVSSGSMEGAGERMRRMGVGLLSEADELETTLDEQVGTVEYFHVVLQHAHLRGAGFALKAAGETLIEIAEEMKTAET